MLCSAVRLSLRASGQESLDTDSFITQLQQTMKRLENPQWVLWTTSVIEHTHTEVLRRYILRTTKSILLLPAPTNSKPDRSYKPTTHSTLDSHISPQNTPCTAERTPTSHQERTPRKVCLLPRKWWDRWTFPIPLPTVRQHQIQTTASSTEYTHNTLYGSTIQHFNEQPPTNWRDKIVRSLGDQER